MSELTEEQMLCYLFLLGFFKEEVSLSEEHLFNQLKMILTKTPNLKD